MSISLKVFQPRTTWSIQLTNQWIRNLVRHFFAATFMPPWDSRTLTPKEYLANFTECFFQNETTSLVLALDCAQEQDTLNETCCNIVVLWLSSQEFWRHSSKVVSIWLVHSKSAKRMTADFNFRNRKGIFADVIPMSDFISRAKKCFSLCQISLLSSEQERDDTIVSRMLQKNALKWKQSLTTKPAKKS